jgi:hypothetical protein
MLGEAIKSWPVSEPSFGLSAAVGNAAWTRLAHKTMPASNEPRRRRKIKAIADLIAEARARAYQPGQAGQLVAQALKCSRMRAARER